MLLKTGASRVSACARRCFKLLRRLAKLDRLPQERLFFQCFLDQAEQLLRRVRFADKMICAALDRLDRVVQRIVRRQNDHLRVRMVDLDLFEHLQAIRVRQLQVEQDERRRFALEQTHSGGGVGRHLRMVTVPP